MSDNMEFQGAGEYADDGDLLGFSNGQLYASAYSYEISSYGSVELSKEHTRKLYEFMHAFYSKEEQK